MSSSTSNIGVTFGPVQSRKRALTRTLLGEDYEEIVTSVLDPPEPLQNLSDYTPERVRKGLQYADTTLRHHERKISPGGVIALNLYKDTCVGLLDLLDTEEGEVFEATDEEREAIQDSHRAFIREAEKGIQISACMKATKTTSAQKLREEIIKLQRFAFYARYGDYFAGVCNELKIAAERAKLPGWQTLSKKYWSDIAVQVGREDPVYQKSLNGERNLHDQMPTTHAIQSAAYLLGLHPDHTLQIVGQYGVRNDLLHANLLPMIKEGDFWGLAQRLCFDRTDIPLLVLASDKADGKILEGLLDSMIDLWFQKNELDPFNCRMWTAKPELSIKYAELNAHAAEEALINQKISKDITKAYKKNLRDSSKEDEMIALFESITGKKKPPKRVASSQLDVELRKLADRKRKWDAIVNLTSNAKSLHDAYVLNGDGETSKPRGVIEDKDLRLGLSGGS